jgi:dipeptidase
MCTTIAIGRKATSNGSVIVAHSDDDVSDCRYIFVPATTNKPGTMRPVHYDNAALGPQTDPATGKPYNASDLYRYIGSSRGPGYVVDGKRKDAEDLYDSTPIGHIPQVERTYAYFDSSYGVMNEHGLMIGECTCGAKVHPLPSPTRLFYAAELARVALERCTAAREAVELIGELILEYGYHGTGETLLVGDSSEVWVVEMCGYDPEGGAGLWVAQRVPDNGFFVAANQFRIREVLTDSPDMLHSSNLHAVCESLGWWSPKDSPLLDWAATVSYGEYSHPYYSLRRVWRALLKAKPSSNLPAWVENGYTKAYPFSVVPDAKLDVASVAAIYRDNYEGTEFDMTKGAAAGPWGDPTRYENNPDKGNAFELSVNRPNGAWERPISIYRCGLLWINEALASKEDAPTNGVAWLGLERPATNCLMPIFCKSTKLPECMETMNLLDLRTESAWWAFNFVANYISLKYSFMVQDVVALQGKLEKAAIDKVASLRKSGEMNTKTLTEYGVANADAVRSAWWDLAKSLIVTYNDGCLTQRAIHKDGCIVRPEATMRKIDYPQRWLERTDYYQGPISYDRQECRTHSD